MCSLKQSTSWNIKQVNKFKRIEIMHVLTVIEWNLKLIAVRYLETPNIWK